jgi:hypothetical protein
MREESAGMNVRGVGTRGSEAAGNGPLARRNPREERDQQNTPPPEPGTERRGVTKAGKSEKTLRRRRESLGTRAKSGVRRASLFENIIGHRIAANWSGWRVGGGVFGAVNGAFALLDEPASEHGVGIFLEPLVEEGTDLFADVGGVAEAREFVALKRVARCGEKELPGWLGIVTGHGALRECVLQEQLADAITVSGRVTSNREVQGLWKNVEKKEKCFGACSGCAGDYEDPDRTAWVEEENPDEEESGDEEARGGDEREIC